MSDKATGGDGAAVMSGFCIPSPNGWREMTTAELLARLNEHQPDATPEPEAEPDA